MHQRKCPLHLNKFVHISALGSSQPLAVFSEHRCERMKPLFFVSLLQECGGTKEVDHCGSVRISYSQLLRLSYERVCIRGTLLSLAGIRALQQVCNPLKEIVAVALVGWSDGTQLYHLAWRRCRNIAIAPTMQLPGRLVLTPDFGIERKPVKI